MKAASDGGILLQDGSNAMVVGSAGISGSGTTLFMVAGGGESSSPGWPLFVHGDYRKTFPATPGIVVWDSTIGQNNVVNGATGAGYSPVGADRLGVVWIATAVNGATGTWAQLVIEAS